MGEDWIFKKALFLIGGLSAIPYVTWPLFILSGLVFLFNKFRPIHAWQTTLLAVWWVLTIIGITLVVTLLIALFSVPENDKVANTVMYLSLIASLPILIPCLIVFLCKPISG